ncbi:von Willebrand factor, type A [Lasallia pustulata]|uniref:von Willebrand factor, type A n=1 Tax=Lasallia pustulata TaxID=136370 RepID=A0A1W5DEI2_9LECA|nr:von Willebrand factor, type A [Lasallia pustulata]
MPFILDTSRCHSQSSLTAQAPSPNTMGLRNFLRSKSRKNSGSPSRTPTMKSAEGPKSNIGSMNPPAPSTAPPTRRPAVPIPAFGENPDSAPPPYTKPAPEAIITGNMTTTADNPYAFLSDFDTIFLIDDSGSMAGRSWRETAAALKSITPICTAHDADGIDIYFLNSPDSSEYRNLTRSADVDRIFESVKPRGGTPTGTRLNAILKPYLRDVETRGDAVKPLNIIVITDGVPSDDVESVIINAAKKLDKWDSRAWQVGIQFFQVGEERGAAEALRELDDGLAEMGGGTRDIVDTVPWNGTVGSGLNGDGILKVVLGAVNRRLDRKRNSREWGRTE